MDKDSRGQGKLGGGGDLAEDYFPQQKYTALGWVEQIVYTRTGMSRTVIHDKSNDLALAILSYAAFCLFVCLVLFGLDFVALLVFFLFLSFFFFLGGGCLFYHAI